jgi:predicted ATP-grasp superfamily ATP-dependent carboligase
MGADMVVSLGALIADVAHTMPVPITGIGSDRDLVERLGFERSDYEGPTGVVGVFHDTCRRLGMNSASLWAAIPHYVAAVPNPKASLALIRKLEQLVGVTIDAAGMERSAERFERQVDRAIESNPEVQSLVANLEEAQREEQDAPEADVPSGDALAKEFQRFLRQQDDDE